MKKILIALIFVGVGIVVAPFVTGYFAESENRRMLEVINRDQANNGRVDIASYDRGYVGSQVEYEYHLPASLAAIWQIQAPVTVSCDYTHGIASVDYDCSLDKNEFYTSFLNSFLGGNDPLSITGSASAFGSIEQVIALDDLSSAMPSEGATISLAASKLVMQSDKALINTDFSGKIGDLKITDKDGTFAAAGTTLAGSLEVIGEGLYVGETTVDIASMSMQSSDNDMLMSDLKFSSDVQDLGENLDIRVSYKLGSLRSGGEGFDVDDVEIAFDMLGVDKQAMIAYQEWSQDMQAAMVDVDEEVDTFAMPDMTGIMQIADMALKKGLQFDFKGSGNVDKAANRITASIKLLEGMEAQELQSLMMDPDNAFQKITLDLDVQLDKTLIESTPTGGMVIQSPMFQKSETSYSSIVKLGPSSSLNGQAITVTQLIGMLMPQPQMQPEELMLEGNYDSESF